MNKNLFPHGSGYGQLEAVAMAVAGPTFGKIFVVMPSTDPNYDKFSKLVDFDRDGQVRLLTTLEAAYDAAVTNRNDVILLSANSSHSVSAGMAWTKSRIHVVGMDGGGRLVQQGAKVVSTSTDDTGYVLKVTGTRNSFRNIKFIQQSTDAAALTVVQMGGEGNLYENCSFTFGVADNLDGATTYEVVNGEDSGTFINCEFGSDTLVTSAARAVMAIDQVTSGQEMKDCRFKDCVWTIQSSEANANFIRVLATTDLKFASLFLNPIFLAAINQTNSAVTLTDAVDSVSGLVEGNVLFVNPASNCTNFSSAITDNLKVVGPGMDGTTPAAKIGIGLVPS